MQLTIFEPSQAKLWDEIINHTINGTLFHSWEWLKIIEKYSDSQLIPLVFYDSDDDIPFGAIPLFFVKKMGLKLIFSPPPATGITLGPVLVKKGYKQYRFEMAYQDFANSIDEFLKKINPNYYFIITSPGLLDVRPFLWNNFDVVPSYTYKLNLTLGEENIWNNLSQSLKTNIKTGRKQGIDIIESHDIQSAEYVFASLKQRLLQQGRSMSLKLDYLKELLGKFDQSAIKTYLARYNGKIVGSDICIIYRDTTISWMGGSRNESNKIKANELLRWHEIEEAMRNGFKWFEIEGANTIQLCDSKSRFDPDISLYFMLKRNDLIGKLVEKAYLMF
jgi:lipid II:glycine glycyltransferase (peptidoglycan interpeptide bridge formation enzyme)